MRSGSATYAALAFVVLLAVGRIEVACGGAGAEGGDPDTPSRHNLPPDRTEVKMEVVSVDGGEGAPPSAGAAPAVAPKAAAAPTGPDPSEDPNIGGVQQDAAVEKALSPVRPRLRACYKKALTLDANTAGTAVFDAVISKDGKVATARFVKSDGLTEEMVGCLLTSVKAMTFDNGKKTQIVPLSFGSPKEAPKQ
jgi:hypothetical protein